MSKHAIISTARRVRLAVIGLRGLPDVIGGIETHCATLYPELAEQLPEVDITLLVRRRYVDKPRFVFRSLPVRALWAPRRQAIEVVVHSLLATFYARLFLRADVVHLHGIGPGFFAPLARMLGMQVVVTSHAPDYRRPKWGRFARAFLRSGEWLSSRAADRVICVSEVVRAELLAAHPVAAGKAVTIRHGVHLPLSPVDRDDHELARFGLRPGAYILAAGRLDTTKRFEDLITAHRRSRIGTLPLVIAGSAIGDDDYPQRLRNMAGPGVLFVGYCSGALLTALYRQAALLVHAAEMEGFGLVILEALSVGAPVAVSDLPVHREFGLPDASFFRVGDLPAIQRAMEAAVTRHAPWPPAPAIVARHSHKASAAAHAALFRELLRRSTKARYAVADGELARTSSKTDQ